MEKINPASKKRQHDTPGEEPPPRYPWAKLMALKRLDVGPESINNGNGPGYEMFQGLIGPVFPAESKIAFGGHAYAQAAYAASKTVMKGFVLHVRTFFFTCLNCWLLGYAIFDTSILA